MGTEWQDKYRLAKANESVIAEFVNSVVGLKNQYEVLSKKDKEDEQSIEEA